MINLSDPTPLTATEALILLLNASDHLMYDDKLSVDAIGWAMRDLGMAEYRLRREQLVKKAHAGERANART